MCQEINTIHKTSDKGHKYQNTKRIKIVSKLPQDNKQLIIAHTYLEKFR